MKIYAIIFIFLTYGIARAELPYKLPRNAKYTVSAEEIASAKANLSTNLMAVPAGLTNLFSSPMMCGAGLWAILKDSSYFSKPPTAKTTARVPDAKGKLHEMPAALLQTEDEVNSFRKALADLLKSQSTLTFREPNKDEFMTFWAMSPFDKISGALLVADGEDITIFFEFGKKDRAFWVDEVKKIRAKK